MPNENLNTHEQQVERLRGKSFKSVPQWQLVLADDFHHKLNVYETLHTQLVKKDCLPLAFLDVSTEDARKVHLLCQRRDELIALQEKFHAL